MRSTRLVLNIISIITNILAGLVFLLPVWYFSITTINKEELSSSTHIINVFDYDKLNQINKIYNGYGYSLNTLFSKLFLGFSIFTIIVSIVFIIFCLLTMSKKLPTYNGFSKTCKWLSFSISILSIISLIIAIIFVSNNSYEFNESDNVTRTLSASISIGIYLFVIFELAGGICGYIANNTKEE